MSDERLEQIRRVKEANDIVEVVGSYVTLRPAGATYKGLCPFHDDRHPSFDVDPRRQRYRCWACGKHGDVIQFVQEFDRVDFREALELLARRVGITLEKKGDSRQNLGRAAMLEQMRWAAEQFHHCLLDDPIAETARLYLGERGLTGETVRRWGLGYAPASGDWLVQRAQQAGMALEGLERIGLLARRSDDGSYYCRFRDRIQFPIRNTQGQIVGFGGRILPNSPLSERGPKYYNSCDTPLFRKSEHLYGLDVARHAAAKAGYLAVVEGYTDVLMAHQMGIPQVVATLGTSLNARHVRQLRRFVPRVVLVFDADSGGRTGVDRALEIFASEDVELAVATLPEGLDPCDLLVRQGPGPFLKALNEAVDALEFKLNQVWAAEAERGIEGRRRALEAVLAILARTPPPADQGAAIKQELLVSRLARRFGVHEESVWARLRELRQAGDRPTADPPTPAAADDASPRSAPAAPRERELLELLLADPELVPTAAQEVRPGEIEHPGLRRLLEGLYRLHAEGQRPDLDLLRDRIDNPPLLAYALKMQERGQEVADRPSALSDLLSVFRQRRQRLQTEELRHQLHGVHDHAAARELLRQLQDQREVR
ncbi:MAG: DNA primase [Gemmataceae bacterium]|nr:DNA primase [Gemmataceae bacterium]MDW8266886.1 DNA primase [Gemmataceae bacterium]